MRLSKTVPASSAIALLLVFWVFIVALNAPGHLSYDSVVQLYEARTRSLFSMHPPAMAMLMSLGDALIPGTVVFLVAMTTACFVSLMVTTQAGRDNRVALIYLPITTLFLTSPLLLIYQGIIWKDVLFANLFVLTFALAILARRSATMTSGLMWLVAAASVAGLAALIRQQGIVAPAILVLTVAAMQASTIKLRGLRVLITLAASFAALVTIEQAVLLWAHNSPPDTTDAGVATLQRFDILGMAAEGVDLPEFLTPEDRSAIVYYASSEHTSARIDPIDAPNLPEALLAPDFPIRETWKYMLLTDPAAYVRHRFAHMLWVLWPPQISECLPVHVGVGGDIGQMEAIGLSPIERSSLYSYAQLWFATPFFRHAYWLIANLLLCVLLIRRRCRVPGDEAVLGALVGAQLFAGSYLLIGIACDFRYLYTLPLTVIFASLWIAAGWRSPVAIVPIISNDNECRDVKSSFPNLSKVKNERF